MYEPNIYYFDTNLLFCIMFLQLRFLFSLQEYRLNQHYQLVSSLM